MKKNYIFKFILFLIPLSALLLMSNSTGFGGTASGSPLDGNSCAQCHSGGNLNASTVITTNIPDTGYELNTDYTITINTTSNSTKLGFQLAAENSTEKVGTFKTGTGTKLVGSNLSQSTPSSSGDWSVVWTSPSTDKGNVTFYTAVNATNNNGGTSGDQTVLASKSMPSLSTKNFNALAFDMYPNPASERVTLQLPNGSDNAKVEFYDYIGRLSLTENITLNNNKVDVNSLSSGIYLIKVVAHGKIGTKKFIKQ